MVVGTTVYICYSQSVKPFHRLTVTYILSNLTGMFYN